MLPHLTDFRKSLSNIMIKAIHSRVIIYGYGYTGQFLKWYANYYHGIEVDYVISEKRHSQYPPTKIIYLLQPFLI